MIAPVASKLSLIYCHLWHVFYVDVHSYWGHPLPYFIFTYFLLADVLRIQEAKRPKIITFGEDDFPDEDDPFSSEDEKEWRDTFPTLPPARVPVPELVVNYRRVLKHLPTVPHVPISCSDGSRVYLRIFPEKTLGDVQIVPKQKTSLLGVSFQELRRRAQISVRVLQKISSEFICIIHTGPGRLMLLIFLQLTEKPFSRNSGSGSRHCKIGVWSER